MSENLEDKIKLLLTDMEKYNRFDKVVILKRFIEAELGLMEAEVEIQPYDLQTVHSIASRINMELHHNQTFHGKRLADDSGMMQTFCYFQAIYMHFKSKGFIKQAIGFKKS